MAILVVDFLISEPSLREKKTPTNALISSLSITNICSQQKHETKKNSPSRNQQRKNIKKTTKLKKPTESASAGGFPTLSRPKPRRWICLPKTLKWISAGICRSKAWSPVMFTNNSGLPVVKCTVMSVFGSKPSWTQVKWMAKCPHIESELCIYRLYAINKCIYIYTNLFI